MRKRALFKFYSTISDRGQIFIPKVIQEYFGIKKRDKVVFVVKDDGSVMFSKKKDKEREEDNEKKVFA